MDVNICKIQKAINFTYFTPKIFHISPSKIVHIYTFTTVIMHIYTVTIIVSYYFINFSFHSLFSHSSPSAKPTHTSSLPHHLLLPLIHTNTPTQTNQHRDTQNPKPTISHCLIEPARVSPPKHRSHHPPHTVQPSPPPPKPVKTTETQNPQKINSKLNH